MTSPTPKEAMSLGEQLKAALDSGAPDTSAADAAVDRLVALASEPSGELETIRSFLQRHVQCNVDRMSLADLHSAVDALAEGPPSSEQAAPSPLPGVRAFDQEAFDSTYNKTFRGKSVNTQHLNDCELIWRAALASQGEKK